MESFGVHHKGVGRKGQPAGLGFENRAVVKLGQHGVGEHGQQQLGGELMGDFAARAVIQKYFIEVHALSFGPRLRAIDPEVTRALGAAPVVC